MNHSNFYNTLMAPGEWKLMTLVWMNFLSHIFMFKQDTTHYRCNMNCLHSPQSRTLLCLFVCAIFDVWKRQKWNAPLHWVIFLFQQKNYSDRCFLQPLKSQLCMHMSSTFLLHWLLVMLCVGWEKKIQCTSEASKMWWVSLMCFFYT